MLDETIINPLIKAAQVGKEAMGPFTQSVTTHCKQDGSLVTDADLASQEAIIQSLTADLPGIGILSEETNGEGIDLASGDWLIVDPLDGTTHFSRKIPYSSVTVAFVSGGLCQAGVVQPIFQEGCYAAVRDRFSSFVDGSHQHNRLQCRPRPLAESVLCMACDFSAPAGRDIWWQWLEKLRPPVSFRVRLVESSALELCLLAEGKTDGYLHPTDKPWDMAAAGLIVQQANARLCDIDGGPFQVSTHGIIAATPAITDEILMRIN